jgi:hypothetical protein
MENLIKINPDWKSEKIWEFENQNDIFSYFLENEINIYKSNTWYYLFAKDGCDYYIFSFLQMEEIKKEKEIFLDNMNHLEFFHDDVEKF